MTSLRPEPASAAGLEPGMLLVASPMLRDPNFVRTVVYVIDHRSSEDAGTTGVILNRPSEVELLDVLPQWWEFASGPRTLFVGGPVEADAALCLAQAVPGHQPEGFRSVSAGIGLTDLDADPAAVHEGVSALRVFLGYAGWGAQQLDAEIAEGAWLVVAGRPSDVFADPTTDLWRDVLRRQGGRLAMIASYPDNPRLN
jgi:putative transcriptional regulator